MDKLFELIKNNWEIMATCIGSLVIVVPVLFNVLVENIKSKIEYSLQSIEKQSRRLAFQMTIFSITSLVIIIVYNIIISYISSDSLKLYYLMLIFTGILMYIIFYKHFIGFFICVIFFYIMCKISGSLEEELKKNIYPLLNVMYIILILFIHCYCI